MDGLNLLGCFLNDPGVADWKALEGTVIEEAAEKRDCGGAGDFESPSNTLFTELSSFSAP